MSHKTVRITASYDDGKGADRQFSRYFGRAVAALACVAAIQGCSPKNSVDPKVPANEGKLSTSTVIQAQQIWTNDFFQLTDPYETAPDRLSAYSMISNLDPALVRPFLAYLDNSAAHKLDSGSDAKKLIVDAISILYPTDPALATKYFNAISKLTESCDDDPQAFLKGLHNLADGINAILNPNSQPNQSDPDPKITDLSKLLDAATNGKW